MTERIDFSVGKKHHKVIDIIDAWKMKGSYSDKICTAITKQYEEENRGNKLDSYAKELKPLNLFPSITEEWTADKLQQYNIKDVQEVVAMLYKRRQELSAYLNSLAKLR